MCHKDAGSLLFYHRIWSITSGLETYGFLENNYSWDVSIKQPFLCLFVTLGDLVYPFLLDEDIASAMSFLVIYREYGFYGYFMS